MAKWRIQTDVEFDSDGSRGRIKALLNSKRSGKSIFKIDRDLKDVNDDGTSNGKNTLKIKDDIRFNSKQDADSYAAELKDEMTKTNNNRNIPQVTITEHLCPHDDDGAEFYDCRTDAKAQFVITHQKTKGG